MFAKKPKLIKDKVCYQCGKPEHIARGCKVMMEVVEGNSSVEDLRQGEANERGGAIEEDGWDPEADFVTIVETIEVCEYRPT